MQDNKRVRSNPQVDPVNPGRKNIYACKDCGSHIVTVDKDQGVTPFMIRCVATHCEAPNGRKGMMQSSMYRVFDPDNIIRPSYEWYRPGLAQILSIGEAEHVKRGGLLLRPIKGN